MGMDLDLVHHSFLCGQACFIQRTEITIGYSIVNELAAYYIFDIVISHWIGKNRLDMVGLFASFYIGKTLVNSLCTKIF